MKQGTVHACRHAQSHIFFVANEGKAKNPVLLIVHHIRDAVKTARNLFTASSCLHWLCQQTQPH